METAEQRSRIMRAVKSRDTAPELAVRRLVHGKGYRFRLHRKDLPGNPDIVLSARRKVILVHGCFWHGHRCARGDRQPKTNRAYWALKITRNRKRDTRNRRMLRTAGWSVLVVWECQLKDATRLARRIDTFLQD